MTDIKIIIDSHKLHFELVEIENRIPSFKMNVFCQIQRLKGEVNFSESLWFESKSWDHFINEIVRINATKKPAILSDMSEEFILKLSPEIMSFQLNSKSPAGGSTELRYSQPLTDDSFAIVKNALLGFDKWW